MKDLIRYIKSVMPFKKKENDEQNTQEEEDSLDQEFPSGTMKLLWDATTGDFVVDFEINDSCEESSETLAMLLYFMEKGDLNPFIVKSLQSRSEEINESFYPSVIMKWLQLAEAFQQEGGDEKAIVGASEVFNFASIKQ